MTTRSLIVTLGLALTPTLAFILHDFVFQLPDNQHEASLGFILSVFGLLFVWALCGYLVAASTRTTLAAIGRGMITTMLSVGILWLAFLGLNSLFTDRMSYEPDRIRAFKASVYPTMQDYVSHIPSHVVYPSPGCWEFTVQIAQETFRVVREIKSRG